MRSLILIVIPGMVAACSSVPPAELEHVVAEDALGPYSGAVLLGDLCFVSGKIGTTGGSFADEVETAIDRVEEELDRAGLGLGDVASVTVFLTDIANYRELNGIYEKRFPSPYPARACVAVNSLPGQARVEIQVIARRG